ncbi:hypothetical protein BOX15_Mlig017312g2, partial [Macrostomum lignano]
SDMSPAVAASGIVIYRTVSAGVQYLLLHATIEEGLWTPPKGHVDPGEDLRQCAIRETAEECGLKEGADYRLVPDWVHAVSYVAFGKQKSVTYYLGQMSNPDAPIRLSDEHKDFAWCSIERAKELVKFKESIEVLQSAHQYIADMTAKSR